jgi:hypothetical protein
MDRAVNEMFKRLTNSSARPSPPPQPKSYGGLGLLHYGRVSKDYTNSSGRMPTVPLDPTFADFAKVRSDRFYECFPANERLGRIKSWVAHLESRPTSEAYMAATAELLRAVSMLHYAVFNWHAGKQEEMTRNAFSLMTPDERRRLIEREHRLLIEAVDDNSDRELGREGMTTRQRLADDALEETLLNQTGN